MKLTRFVTGLIQKRERSQRFKIEKGFAEAVKQIGFPIDASNLPYHSVKVLGPKLSKKIYEVEVRPMGFGRYSKSTGSQEEYLGDVSGVAIFTVGSPSTTRPDPPEPHASQLALPSGKTLLFYPRHTFRQPVDQEINAFAHVLLLHNKRKPVIFIPCFQKVTRLSKKENRRVDPFADSQGSGRHLLLLALGHRLVRELKENGVKAELHIPAPEHLSFVENTPEETKQRTRQPFEQLSRHFKPGTVVIGGVALKTINLSKPKQRAWKIH